MKKESLTFFKYIQCLQFHEQLFSTGMNTTVEKGRHYETIAAEKLQSDHWRIVERNFRAHRYEADIIAVDGRDLVFVEVKFRKNNDDFDPGKSITQKKMKNIRFCAKYFLQIHPEYSDYYCRFDTIILVNYGGEIKFIHYKNAFY